MLIKQLQQSTKGGSTELHNNPVAFYNGLEVSFEMGVRRNKIMLNISHKNSLKNPSFIM